MACVGALIAACGEDDESATTDASRPAPAASEFPAVDGRTLEQIYADSEPGELVVSPASSVFTEGKNRAPFGLFTVGREQITDADVAIYTAPGPGTPAEGPFTASVESLATEPAFVARSTAADPDAGKAVYVTDLELDRPGAWRLVALVRRDGETTAVRAPSIEVSREDPILAPGDAAPRVHTPTAEDVGGDLSQIDTRVPPSTMHDQDLAEVLGKEPAVLVFATPALCQSRTCGPVVDIAEQVKRDHADDAAFIHMEIYENNDPNDGLRPQVRAYGLATEPWVFVIDREGRIETRFEGAVSVDELEAAVERVSQ